MGKFSSKPKSVDTDKIRKEEEARIKRENLKSIKDQEANRVRTRARAMGEDDEEQISRKRLLGQ